MIKSVIETLESRVLLSAAVVDIQWNGAAHRVFQNEYVARVSDQTPFAKIAALHKWGVDDVQSLGGGFCKFTSQAPIKLIQNWAKGSHRLVIVPNYAGSFTSVPNDTLFANQWHLQNTGQFEPDPVITDNTMGAYANANGTVGADINAPAAWDITTGARNVVVAVLDSGIDTAHPDLVDNIYTNPGEIAGDGIDNDGNGLVDDVHGYSFYTESGDVTDLNGHGTHVAGIIGATGNNGQGVSGVNQLVTILPIQIGSADGSVSFAASIEGIYYCIALKQKGVNIVAMNGSFGGSNFPFDGPFANAITAAGEAGILFVVAAGNSTSNVDRTFDFPAKFSLSNSNVITVAAMDNQYKLATFSSYGGASVQVAAPGADILSTAPTYPVSLVNDGAMTQNYSYLSGTSMASPVVAGIIALEAAANPKATMAQLKDALLRSVDITPGLASINSLPAKVGQVGVVDAYRAVRAVLNANVGSNDKLGGTWQAAYGSQGAFIVGDSPTFPGFVTGASSADAVTSILRSSSKRAQALQKATLPNDRIEAVTASTTGTVEVDLIFTDGLSHRVSLYMADYDNKHRVQTVSVVDADTNQVLDVRTVSKFAKGHYETFDLTGHVRLRIIAVKGPSAVFSGVFFDPAPTGDVSLHQSNNTTGGKWTSRYGSQGAYIIGESTAAPAFVSIAASGKTDVIEKSSTTNAAALQLQGNLARGIVGYWSSTTSFDVDLNFNDGQTHRTTLYFLDWKKRNRQTRVQVSDPTGAVLYSSTDLSDFSKGKYLSFDLSGAVKIKVINLSGKDAVLNGIFFDATPAAKGQFLGIDSTTRGNWRNVPLGTSGSLIAGTQTFEQFNASQLLATVSSTQPYFTQIDKDHSPDRTALQKATDISDRIQSHYLAYFSMTFDISLSGTQPHRLSMYASDPSGTRAQTVELLDGDTGQVISTTNMQSFKKGQYVSWQVHGHVQIRVTTQVTQTIAVDGLLFD